MSTETPIEIVTAALLAYAPGVRNPVIERISAGAPGRAYVGRTESYEWAETALVAAWTALGFEAVVSPGWGKPFDSTAEDDRRSFDVATRVIGHELFAGAVRLTLATASERPGSAVPAAITRWVAITALQIAAETYAQCAEDGDGD